MRSAFESRSRALSVLSLAVWGNSFFVSDCMAARYGVGAAGVERMTAGEAFQAKPEAFCRSVDFDGFAGVIRTGRVEAAGRRQQRRDQAFVTAEEEDDDGDRDSLHLMKKRLTSL